MNCQSIVYDYGAAMHCETNVIMELLCATSLFITFLIMSYSY